ncbi:MAG: papain-like cysteine protease family protein [bacterium]|nr:papain-like cysteine protease family protein [bacterium]
MKRINVPYVAQTDDGSCGAAALEMIYKYYGEEDISQDKIFEKHKSKDLEESGVMGIATDDLVDDARERGFISYWGRADVSNKEDSLRQLRKFLDRKIPLIVEQQSTSDKKLGHYRVVFGVDNKYVYLHDPDDRDDELGGASVKVPIDRFMELWHKTGKNVTGGLFIFIL